MLLAVVSKTSGMMVNASCNSTITVSCLKQLYNAVSYSPSATSKNQLAITGYLEQYANRKDLQLFFRDQVPTAINSTFEFVSIKGVCGKMKFTRSARLITTFFSRWYR